MRCAVEVMAGTASKVTMPGRLEVVPRHKSYFMKQAPEAKWPLLLVGAAASKSNGFEN
jgi:hypothetical protein